VKNANLGENKTREGRVAQEDTYSYPTAADQSNSKSSSIRSRMLIQIQGCSVEGDGCARHCFVCTCQIRCAVSGQSTSSAQRRPQSCGRSSSKPSSFSNVDQFHKFGIRRPDCCTTLSDAYYSGIFASGSPSTQDQFRSIKNYPQYPAGQTVNMAMNARSAPRVMRALRVSLAIVILLSGCSVNSVPATCCPPSRCSCLQKLCDLFRARSQNSLQRVHCTQARTPEEGQGVGRQGYWRC
jgi:hypothetical protein